MVWKRLKFIICLFVIIATAMPQKAFAYSVYTEGNMSTTYITYFEDIVAGIKPSQKYIAYRSGQNEYTLAVGDLSISNSKVSSAGTTKLYIYSTQSSGYNSIYKYNVAEVSDFSLSVNDMIVYSNLGDFPLLEERSVMYEYSTLFILCIIALCMFLRSIFSFTYRLRSR